MEAPSFSSLNEAMPIKTEATDAAEGRMKTAIKDLCNLRRSLFDASTVRNQRFITVSPMVAVQNHSSYKPIKICQNERSKFSRILLIETMSIPYLTAECSLVLQEAQQLNLWDQAVAELLSQVLTITHCHCGDDSLQGLRDHILSVYGVAC
jgi:hypothetical protein